MSSDLEEEMRRALFGQGAQRASAPTEKNSKPSAPKRSLSITSKIKVTLHVSNVYEGDYQEVVFESSSLSALVAEMDARKHYQKKFRYITVVSTDRS
ncbi:hypothetical protein [Pseudomonas asiatica]|uniref:Uncharacterized protein n=1 Tax=Pseudomonas asiatica TaxID=2219225 RepID=A0A9X4D2D0_9PSED|nr:hypothetical protein [Pseudomonas asiatica]MDD2108319.1 hypothetical protein [Pseudomonas asiatica]